METDADADADTDADTDADAEKAEIFGQAEILSKSDKTSTTGVTRKKAIMLYHEQALTAVQLF